jgi:DNA primase
VTALYGTNGFTDDHRALLRKNQVEAVCLVLDGDDAGRRAAEKIGAALKTEGLDVFTVKLPEGEDANSFFQSHTVCAGHVAWVAE